MNLNKTMIAMACSVAAASWVMVSGCVAPLTGTSTSTSTSTATSTPPPQGAVYVSSYGAAGDGVTDDSAAIQSAIDALGDGDALAFDVEKTYLLAGNLRFVTMTNFAVYGQNSTLKLADSYDFTAEPVPIMFDRLDTFSVYDLVVNGNRLNNVPDETYSRHSILIESCKNFSFIRVESSSANCDGFLLTTGNKLDTDTYNKNGNFINCKAEYCYRDGMSIIFGWDINVIGGSFSYSNGTMPKSGIDVESDHGAAEPGNQNVLISNVTLKGNNGHGIKMDHFVGNHATTIEYCYFSDNLRSAIYFTSSDNIIRHNVFYGFDRWTDEAAQPTQGVIRIAGDTAENNIIEDNIFANIQYLFPSIYVAYQPAVNLTVRNNEFYDFVYYKPMTVSGGEIPADFNDVNTVDQGKVISDPGLPVKP